MFSKIPTQFLKVLAVLLIIFLIGLTGLFRPVRKLAEKSLVIPIRQKIYDWRSLGKKESVNSETEEITKLKFQILSLEEENRQQKRLLSAPLPKDWQFLAVKVIGIENETLILSSGKDKNLKEGLVAVTEENYLGKIYLVSENTAIVRLPSFLDEKTAVSIISSKDGTVVGRGLLEGKAEGKMSVEQIFLSDNAQKGDFVKVSFLGGSLLAGTIDEVVEKKGEMFKSAIVKRNYNPQELGTIFIITGKL